MDQAYHRLWKQLLNLLAIYFQSHYFQNLDKFRLNRKYMMTRGKAFNNVEMYDWLLTMLRH